MRDSSVEVKIWGEQATVTIAQNISWLPKKGTNVTDWVNLLKTPLVWRLDLKGEGKTLNIESSRQIHN